MGVFKDADQPYELPGGLFDRMMSDETIAGKGAESGLVIHFAYTDPDEEIWLDAHDRDPGKIGIVCGPSDLLPEVEMSMKADVAHQFWLGNVNLMVALTSREIVARGPIPKIMKLLPIIKPAYAMYQNLLREKGLESMLTVK